MAEMVVPEVNKEMLADLEAMGFASARATRALHFSGMFCDIVGHFGWDLIMTILTAWAGIRNSYHSNPWILSRKKSILCKRLRYEYFL